MRIHMNNIQPFDKVVSKILDDPIVDNVIKKTLGTKAIIEVRRKIGAGDSFEFNGIGIHDFLEDFLINDGVLYKKFLARGSYGNYPIDIRGLGGVYFYHAPDYGRTGYFLRFSDADDSVIANWSDNLVSTSGRIYRFPFEQTAIGIDRNVRLFLASRPSDDDPIYWNELLLGQSVIDSELSALLVKRWLETPDELKMKVQRDPLRWSMSNPGNTYHWLASHGDEDTVAMLYDYVVAKLCDAKEKLSNSSGPARMSWMASVDEWSRLYSSFPVKVNDVVLGSVPLVISDSEISNILSQQSRMARYIPIQAQQSAVNYRGYFGEPVPEWLKSTAASHAIDICKLAMSSRRTIPSERPAENFTSAINFVEVPASVEIPSRWSNSPREFEQQIVPILEGPYDELLDAIKYLSTRVVDGLPKSDVTLNLWLELEEKLFGNPSNYLRRVENGSIGFGASLIEGPDISIFGVSGLVESDELHYGLWGETNWQDILNSCSSVCIYEDYSIDGMPGQSDTYFVVSVSEPIQFARELRLAMLSFMVFGNDKVSR